MELIKHGRTKKDAADFLKTLHRVVKMCSTKQTGKKNTQ